MALENVEDIYKLSPVQQGMLFHTLYSPESEAYFDQFVVPLGGIDAAALERAWQQLTGRHAVLRTSFLWEDLEEPVQVVHRSVALEVCTEDWSHLGAEEQEARLASFRAEDRRRGFDLTRAPLLRLTLIRFGDGDHRVVWSYHHLLLDGWSVGLVLSELKEIFTGAARGVQARLKPVRPFKDYIRWLRKQDLAEAESYWRRVLSGFSSPTPLGIGRAPAAAGSVGFLAWVRRFFGEGRSAALQGFARQHRLTLPTVVQAAWALALARFSGRGDVVFGVTVSGRPPNLSGVDTMVGCFINTLPVRVRVKPGEDLGAWLGRRQEDQLALRRYEYSPLVEVRKWSEVPHDLPLFESIVVFEGFTESGGYESFQRTNFPLVLGIVPQGGDLRLGLGYDAGRFEATEVRRLLGTLETVLTAFLEGGHLRLGELPVLAPAQRHQLLAEWNESPEYADDGLLLHEMFEAQASRTPEAVAVVHDGTRLLYGELDARANRLARHLQALGVGPESLVGVCLERSLDLALCLLGILKAGGAYVPLDPGYPEKRLAFMVEDAGVTTVVTEERFRGVLPPGPSLVRLDEDAAEIERRPTTKPRVAARADHPLYVIYTSGSTGRPKGAVVCHGAVANRVRYDREVELDETVRFLQLSPISFDMLLNQLFSPLVVGGRSVVARGGAAKDPSYLVRRIAGEGVTHAGFARLLLSLVVEEEGFASCTSLRHVVTGGEAVPPELARRFYEVLGSARLFNRYGPTETTVAVTSWTCRRGASERVLPIGRPIAKARLYVADPRAELVPPGTRGELWVGGTCLARGYLRRPGRTAESFVPDAFGERPGERVYRTGDLVRHRGDGALEFVGRVDQQVKIHGFRVELGEIEDALRRLPGVNDAAVVDLELGGSRRLVAYPVAAAGVELEAGRLRELLADSLPDYMVPAAFVPIAELPLLPNGKVDRRSLPAPDWGAADETASRVAMTPTEEILAGIWCDVLEIERLEVDQSFFELGGHSLLATRIMSRVRRSFGVELPLRRLFEAPTVASLAAEIDAARRPEDGMPPLEPASPRPEELPLSFGQERLWFLDRFEPGSPWYNVPAAVSFHGGSPRRGADQGLSPSLLDRCLAEIERRHEVLRTRFEAHGGRAVARISDEGRLGVSVVDVTRLDAASREAESRRISAREWRRPFDLERDPLLRLVLVEVGKEEHLAVLTMHHIVFDGWSVGILVREIGELYRAFLEGRPSPLPELRVQYADYAAWQRKWLSGPRRSAEAAYWKEKLAGAPTVLELATDRPRPAVQTYRGAQRLRLLGGETPRRLELLGRESGSTLFMTLLAGLSALLHRLSGQPSLLVGTPVANRRQVETEELIGVFINTLVLRADLGGDPAFRDHLERTRETTLEAYAHQDLPFEIVVDELQPSRELAHSPLFQVMLILQNVPMGDLELPGLTLTPVQISGSETAKFDLTLSVAPAGSVASVRLEYNRDLFDATTAERMLRHFEALLASAVEDPKRRISELAVLAPSLRQQVLVEWNDTAGAGALPEAGVHELVERVAESVPDRVAVAFPGSPERQLSYRVLVERAEELARRLRGLGVGPETRVGLGLDRSVEMVVAVLGVLRSKGAYVPLDPSYPRERLAYVVADAGVRVLVTREKVRERLPSHGGEPVLLEEGGELTEPGRPRFRTSKARGKSAHPGTADVPSAPRTADVPSAPQTADVPSAPRTADGTSSQRLAYVLYTSGSTGRPKGVQISHGALVNFLGSMARTPGFTSADTLLAVTTLSFDIAGLELFLPLVTGGRVVIAPFETLVDGRRLSRLLEDSRATVMQATPATWRLLLDSGWSGRAGLRVLSGGENLPRDLASRLLAAGELWNLYGPTETTIWSAAARVGRRDGPLGGDREREHGPVSIGRPVARTGLSLLDRYGNPVPPGVPGELFISGAGLSRGYLGRPALTAERFLPGPFAAEPGARRYLTGDLVRSRASGELEFLGRLDHQVKVRGFRIELEEIEAVVAAHPRVGQAVAGVREDGPGEARIVAYLTLADPAEPAVESELRSLAREKLPEYMVPSLFVTLEAFPLTPNGKVDRAELARRPLSAPDKGPRPTLETPRTAAEKTIVGIWSEVLGRTDVGLDDNFFDLGGHSLLLVRVHSRLTELFGTELTVIDLFRRPTVRGLAELVVGESLTAEAPALTVRRPTAAGSPDVAVVGMAGRFPGSPDLETFWQNLCDGVDAVTFLTDEELAEAGVPEELLRHPDYVKARLELEDFDRFDAAFFDTTPREAQIVDPQQRLFLETAWEALENAGYDPSRYGGRIGVFAGCGANQYQWNLVSNPGLIRALGRFQVVIANDKDFLPTRVSYKLDLKGPSVSVQTACSTSLVAVCLAAESLLAGRSDMALAGGVTVNFGPRTGYLRDPGGIASPDGHTRSFDARAGGTVAGSGTAAVVLKRLDDAVADRDTIHAVVRGFALNNDGAGKVGFTAPSVDGQRQVIAEAQALAGVEPRTIRYVEAHGTATPLGDPIEVTALAQAFRNGTGDAKGFCALGSVKSNIGHADAAAGVAGLIKTVLAVEHGRIPPSLHFEEPNPQIDFASSPFYVATRLAPWPEDAVPRRAGVSSFGIGGTNAHVVVEEAAAAEPGSPSRPWQLLALSARTPTALDRATERLARHLAAHPDLDLADVAYTLQVGRKAFACRRVLVASGREDAVSELRASDSERVRGGLAEAGERAVTFLFPGGGAQYPRMGLDLYRAEPVYREAIDRAAELAEPHLGFDLRSDLYPEDDDLDEAAALLRRTSHALPALFATEYALAELWMSWGIRPRAMIGHSLGEYVAACLSGVLSLADALAVVALRGQLFERLPEGAMLSVPLPVDELEAHLGDELSVAAVNTPSLSVASGPRPAIEELERTLGEAGVETSRLHIDVAAHSKMLGPLLAPLDELLRTIALSPPRIPYVSNVTGTWITPEEATDPGYWPRHLRRTVRFSEGLETLFAELGPLGGDRGGRHGLVVLEVGPGQTLSTLARQHPANKSAGVFSSLRHPREEVSDVRFLNEALGRLWCLGTAVDWNGYSAAEKRRRVPLPTYPFERQRFWVEARDLGVEEEALELEPAAAAEDSISVDASSLGGHVAPRSATEKKLAALWRELLGVERIGVHDNFFELGGSSLLAVRLGSQLARSFERKLSPHFLIETPTLAKLAASLDEGTPEAAESTSPPCLVELQKGDGKAPLFLVHPVGGHVYFYRRLAEELGARHTVYGLQARGLEGEDEPFDDLRAMAAHYVEAVRTVREKGPYLLGGSSMGGMIAFEMAQQLRAADERVDLLALLDTAGPGQMPSRPETDAEILAYLVRDRMGVTEEELRGLPLDEQISRVIETARGEGALPPDLDLDSVRRLLYVVRTHLKAMFGYEPGDYPGRILFFRARERQRWDASYPELAWIDRARDGVEAHVVPGDHITMHHPPHLEVLAAKLGEALARLRR